MKEYSQNSDLADSSDASPVAPNAPDEQVDARTTPWNVIWQALFGRAVVRRVRGFLKLRVGLLALMHVAVFGLVYWLAFLLRFEFNIRQNIIEQVIKNQSNLVMSTNKPSSASTRARGELDSVKSQLLQLRSQFSEGVINARTLELERKHRALSTDQELYVNLVSNYEKEVEKAKKEAENIGKSFVEVQMMQADVENIEHLLKGVAEECERVKFELRSQARVKILGEAVVTGGAQHGGGKNFHYESSALPDAEVPAIVEELS